MESQSKIKVFQHRRLHEIQSTLPSDYDTDITTLAHSILQVTVTRKKLRDTIIIEPSLRRQHLQELTIALKIDGKYPKGKAI